MKMFLTWFAEKLLAISEFGDLIEKPKRNQRSLRSRSNNEMFRLCTPQYICVLLVYLVFIPAFYADIFFQLFVKFLIL